MNPPPHVAIGRRLVGSDQPVYVIAEAGVNHDGDIESAHQLIEAAAQSGADAVKFQLFSADRLVAADAPTCAYQSDHVPDADSQLDLLRKLELPAESLAKLKSHADQLRIDFLATPFGLPEVHTLAKLGVPAIKIASPDIVNVPLLRTAADTGFPLIVSTGASDLSEVEFAVKLLSDRQEPGRLILMHCVSAYPTPVGAARLRCIQTLAERFDVPVGFSDHTTSAEVSALAVSAGAALLEKHLTLDRRRRGPDHFFSLEPDDFAQYVQAAREASAAQGDGRIACDTAEVEVRRLSRGSVVAAVDLPAGRPIREDQLVVRRPGGGIDPRFWDRIIGKKPATDIRAGTPLDWEMLSMREIPTPTTAAITL